MNVVIKLITLLIKIIVRPTANQVPHDKMLCGACYEENEDES